MKKIFAVIICVPALFFTQCTKTGRDSTPALLALLGRNHEVHDKFGFKEGSYTLFNYFDTNPVDFNFNSKLADITVRDVNCILLWWTIEIDEKGNYHWDDYDRFINYAVHSGKRVIIQLHGGNTLYDEPGTVYPLDEFAYRKAASEGGYDPNLFPEGYAPYSGKDADPGFDYRLERVNGWLDFVEAAVRRYGNSVTTWEIWNEENLLGYWQPVIDADRYSALVNATAARIRSVQPGAYIIMGGLCMFDGWRTFMEECLDSDVLDSVDAIGIHPYRMTPEGYFDIDVDPGHGDNFHEEIQDIRDRVALHKTGVDLWDTEAGYINFDYATSENDTAQAKWLTRSMLNEHAEGLKGCHYFKYGAHRDGELFDGLVYDDAPYEASPAFLAFQEIARLIGPQRVVYDRMLVKNIGGDDVMILIYHDTGDADAVKPVMAYWIIEAIDNTEKAMRYKEILFDDVTGSHTYRLRDVLRQEDLDPGVPAVDAGGTTFDNLPVTDYPMILYTEK